jgi:hypothetical protein
MTPRLALIAKQLERREQAPAPVPGSGVGDAIENLIADEVERRVGAALREQAQMLESSRPKPTYSEQIPAPPRTPTPRAMRATIQRDGAGLARAIVINGVRFLVQRDAAGQIIDMVSEDQASEISYNGQPVAPAPFNRGI